MQRNELVAYLNNYLEAERFRDYCPNGIQVEGRDSVDRIVCGVTASRALLDAAVEARADAVLVHHGYFWRGEDPRITGYRRERLATLLVNGISLVAYHLPLDAHPVIGNNAQLGLRLGWEATGRFGDQDVGFTGQLSETTTAGRIADTLSACLSRQALIVGDGNREVRKLAWCTGGAQGLFEQAVAAGADLYVSGEISEQTAHLARETGVPYVAAGHHATERYGIQALAKLVQDNCGVSCVYVEIENPA